MMNLYLPITSQPRELDSKLLLALVACERGMKPFIGYKSAFQTELAHMPSGIFLAHNARQKPESLARIAKYGHRVVVLDEEALVRQSDEIFLRKHPKDAFDPVDKILCWGEDDAEMWERSGLDLPSRSVVGNPRMDILRPELRDYHAASVAKLRNEHGEYVLLNTNYPTVNNMTPQGSGVRLAAWALDERGKQVEAEFLANKRAMYEATLALVEPLARAIAPLKLVIRPHPNEDHAPWYEAVDGIANAEVVFEGSVVPWLLGARALVHNNCTTAVEAAVSATAVLNFRPWQSNYDNPLSHAFGIDCIDAAAIADTLRDLPEETLSQPQRQLLRRHVVSIDGPFACEHIIDVFTEFDRAPPASDRLGLKARTAMMLELRRLWLTRYVRLYTSRSGRKKRKFMRENFPDLPLHKFNFAMLGKNPQQLELMMRQFPPLSIRELDERIDRLSKATGRFSGMRSVACSGGILTVA